MLSEDMKDGAFIPGNRFIVFFRLHFESDPAAQQLLDLLESLYAAIRRALTATNLKPHILTSPTGSGLLCDNAKDAVHLASLVASDLSTAVTIGLEHGYIDDCHTYVLGKDNIVMVGHPINYAARLAFVDNETGSILASPSFANSLGKVNKIYKNWFSDVKTWTVKKTKLEYHVLDQQQARIRFGIKPQEHSPTSTVELSFPPYWGNASVLLTDIRGFTNLPEEQMKPAINKMWTKIAEAAWELGRWLPQHVGAGDGVAFVSPESGEERDELKGSQGYRLFLLAEHITRSALRDNLHLHAALDYGPIATLTLPDNRSMILGPPIIDADDASHQVKADRIALTDRFLKALSPYSKHDVLCRGTGVGRIGDAVVLEISKSPNYYTLTQVLDEQDKHNANLVWVFSESLLMLHGQDQDKQRMAYAILERLRTRPNRNYRYVQFADKQTELNSCRKLFETVKEANSGFAGIDLQTRIWFGVIPSACKKQCSAQKLVAATSPHVVLWRGEINGVRTGLTSFGAMTITSKTESLLSAGWTYLERSEAKRLASWLQKGAGINYI